MAWNLPKAWDPGFVLPKNAQDEGLQRRALVTKQMPRGTYDQPDVGTGGYTVPDYVMDEGYGQGTFTTKWQPSGSYTGPAVPHWLNQRPKLVKTRPLPGGGQAVTVQPLSDDAPLHPLFEDYGQQAAQILISRVAGFPAGKREAALRAVMDKVDKSLWTRTQTIWNRYRSQGVPPAQAFPLALARAMSTGMAAEIIKTGLSGAAPQAKSLLGLGCYGCWAALGADEPAPTCSAPAGFKWVAATASVPGHWERLKAGEVAQTTGAPCDPTTGQPVVPDVRDHTQDDAAVGVLIAPTADFPPAASLYFNKDIPVDKVRDFSKVADYTFYPDDYDPAKLQALQQIKGYPHVGYARDLPQPWRDWIVSDLTTSGGWKDYSYKNDPQLYGWDPANGEAKWYQYLGIPLGATLYSNTHSLPQANITWPVDGSAVGLYYLIEALSRDQETTDRKNANYKANTNPDNPVVLKLWVSKVPDQSFEYEAAQFFAKLIDVIVDAAQDLGALACGLLSVATAPVAGATASVAAGVPATAGSAGVQLARKACGAPPPLLPIVAAPSILPVAILAGGAVLVLAILASKRNKKKVTPP